MRCKNKDCRAQINPMEDDSRYSGNLEGWYCWACYESMTSAPSHVVLVSDGVPVRYMVSGFETVYDDGESIYSGDEFGNALARAWKTTDGWRGHYATRIDGWKEVLGGWTTGDWGDGTSNRKQIFNNWATSVCEGEVEMPVDVVFCVDPTSNIFSTAVTVLVRDADVATFRAFIESDVNELQGALS